MKLSKSILLLSIVSFGGVASAAQIFYGGVLAGANEVPVVNSPGSGGVLVTVDTTANTMRVRMNFRDLIGNASAAHIHFGAGPGTNGGVASQTPSFSGFPLGVKFGAYDTTFDMTQTSSFNAAFVTANGGTAATAWSAFQSRLAQGHGYFNLHSASFPGGEIRANLAVVPEPGSILALGAGALLLLRRRKA